MRSLRVLLVACAAFTAGASVPAAAQLGGKPIEALAGVEIEQKLDARLPRDARFITDTGTEVAFGDLFDGTLPAILTLNYTDCPQLCSVHLSKLVEALGALPADFALGTHYRLVTVSIDARDTAEKAARMKAEYVARYGAAVGARAAEGGGADARMAGEAAAADAWTFLVGDEAAIRAVADAVGFGFKWLPEQKEFAHRAANILCTPDGRVARYLDGIDPIPMTVRMSLVEASEGKIGSLFDGIFLSCFIYDPHLGSYSLAARRVMMAAGGLMVVLVLTGFFFLRRSERRAPTAPVAAEENVR